MLKAKNYFRRGQAMLIATLTLGGVILGVTALAGVLMVYQIRASTDSANSAKALFSADSGIEWALYSYYAPPQGLLPTFSNGAMLAANCYTGKDVLTTCDNADPAATSSYVIAKGSAGNTSRAFLVTFGTATATLP